MTEIKIIEYERKYAPALAEMWNKSADNWGGSDTLETAESVALDVESSANLKTWLALDGREVVGFCSFSEYRDDQGASYIPLLNVRPDYHGKKVGKLLVLKAVAAACQHPWPRLDLYTWPGNTKAVPLYKKCGFFWEDRDDSTHLMNFIPYVLKTEAAAEFFREADWYGDSSREILVEPDGRKENGFDFYEYTWCHGEKGLRMEFERRGRGLRLLETDDWLVSASLPGQELAFGQDYTVNYRLVNKSGKPLQVSFRGLDDQNITFSFTRTVSVEGELDVPARFRVGPIAEEQDTWLTHPAVTAELTINGKKALFRLGVVPKFPLLLRALAPEKEYFPGNEGQLYLNLENGYEVAAEFSFSLPQANFVRLAQKDFTIKLSPREKKAVAVGFSLDQPGLLQGAVEISARPENGVPVKFTQEITALFAGGDSCFGGENNDSYFAVNGRYMVLWKKYSNIVTLRTVERDYFGTHFFRPELGKPYSVEFAKTKPEKVEWEEEKGASVLRGLFRSAAKPGIAVERLVRLEANGLFSQEWSVRNEGEKPVADLWLIARLDVDNPWPVLPLKGRIFESRDRQSYLSSYDLGDLSENWIFFRTGKRGLSWPRDMDLKGHDGLVMEEGLGTLAPGETVKVKPIYLGLGAFSTWQELRRFAGCPQAGKWAGEVTDSLEVLLNDGNPFVQGDYPLTVSQHQQRDFRGSITVSSAAEELASAKISPGGASLSLPGLAPGSFTLLDLAIETTGVSHARQAAAFGCGGRVGEKQEELSGLEVLTVDNGVLAYSASTAFGPWVFSLKYQGEEWLDTSFPKPGPRAWWNPWLGGIGLEIFNLREKSLLAQPRFVKYVVLPDDRGNQWQGIQAEVLVQEHDKYRGLVLRQNALTLPGLAGICTFAEIEHQGQALNSISFGSAAYFKPGGSEQGWVQFLSPGGQRVRLKRGEENSVPDVHKMQVGAAGFSQSLVLFSAEELSGFVDRDILQCGSWKPRNLLPGKRVVTRPLFFLFGLGDVPEPALEPLGKIRWE